MALRRATPLTVRPKGVSDAIDGTNVFPGAMSQLANIIPASSTRGIFVPRPAAQEIATLTGSAAGTPTNVTAFLIVGNIAYGMVSATSGTYAGKDVPFAYNLLTNAFLPVTIPGGSASLPVTQPTAGDWTPPRMAQVNKTILIAHPGYGGGAIKFGWVNVTGFTDASHTGTTHSSTLIDSLSANVLQAGWTPGMLISGGGLPANTTIISIAADGLSLVTSLPSSSSGAAVALTVTGGSAAAPLYGSGDTNGNNLAAVPVDIANFNGRAYFAVPGAGMEFSDLLVPLQRTNATQALTPANGLDITALGGLPVSQTTGGVLQALIGFQGNSGMQQVTGDPALSNLALNNLGVGVGTLAPNTICQTPQGLVFVSPDGLRMIDLLARVSEPIGHDGDGVTMPFILAINPSRMVAAYNEDVLRITVQNGNAAGQPVQEFWYHFSLKSWSGPHSFPAGQIQPWKNTFVTCPTAVPATLWQSDVETSVNTSYFENGVQLSWIFQTTLLPDSQQMAENCVVEATLACSISQGQQFTVVVANEDGGVLDTVLVSAGGAQTIWGGFVWGAAPWGSAALKFSQKPINFHQPIVFKQMVVTVTGLSFTGTALGNINLKYQILGYLIQALA